MKTPQLISIANCHPSVVLGVSTKGERKTENAISWASGLGSKPTLWNGGGRQRVSTQIPLLGNCQKARNSQKQGQPGLE